VSLFPAALDQAYRETDYHVYLPAGEVILRVDQAAPRLDDWLAQAGLECWALLTAWNPGSQAQTDAKNRSRQEALRHLLKEQGRRIYPGINRAPANRWPPEPTFFAPSLKADDALALARRFGQNAVLWGERAHPPRLAWVFPIATDGASSPRNPVTA
jgi:hypothetical protein